MSTFGLRTKRARIARNLTQDDLADLVQTHKNSISALERGKFQPKLILAVRLADELEVCLYYLMGLSNNHRRRVQMKTDQDERNLVSYLQMSTDERQQFSDFVTDFFAVKNQQRQRNPV
jgi:DNA-binding XRE family transcriptional regulator